MKIISSITLDGRSAGSWYAIETARRLHARGHQVLFLPRPHGPTTEMARDAGLPVINDLDLEKKSPRHAWRNLRRLVRLIGEFGPDVVLAHWGEDHAFWGLAKRIAAPKLALVRVRALDPKPPKRHPLSFWLHRQATDMIVTVNSRLYSAYQVRLRIPPDRLSIIEAGIEPNRFDSVGERLATLDAFGVPSGRTVIVLLARFSPVKGHRVLLAAIPRIIERHREAHFLWIGFPSQYNAGNFQRWLVEGNLADRVTVIDRMLPNLVTVLKGCAIGVVASLGSESVSRSLLEYLACGLPAVATDVGGVPDLMGRGDFGVLVRPDDPAALAAGIIALLDDPERRRTCGSRGRDYLLAHGTWDMRIDQWEELLYHTVSRVRGAAIPRLQTGDPSGEGGTAVITNCRERA